jgi:hypothetical protein
MFPTTATIRAAKRDRVAGVQQLPTGTVVSDSYSMYSTVQLNVAIVNVHSLPAFHYRHININHPENET